MIELFLDFVFPPVCIVCNAIGRWFCDDCQQQLRFKLSSDAPIGLLTSLSWIGGYEQISLRQMITCVKYDHALCLMPYFEKLLKQWHMIRSEPWPWAGESMVNLVPIPGDNRRMRLRGLDHALEEARIVQETLIPWAQLCPHWLIRTKHVTQHARLSPDESREININGAFAIGDIDPPAKVVILFDDVYTTGATMQEAACVLRGAGVEKSHGILPPRFRTAG